MTFEFESEEKMIEALSKYRNYYYKWLMLKEITGMESPSFNTEARGTFSPGKEHQMLKRIQDRQDLEEKMKKIELCIESVHEDDYLSWSILNEKFIHFKTLEEISEIFHYSTDHMKHCLYPKAKAVLFEAVKKKSH